MDVWAIMQLENIGFGRKNWDRLFFDNSLDFSEIAAAVSFARSRGIETLSLQLSTLHDPRGLSAFRAAYDF